MKLTDKTYDTLKWIAIYFLPALATFIGICGIALHWQYTDVAQTITSAAGTFVAGCIGMSVREYEKERREKYEGEE